MSQSDTGQSRWCRMVGAHETIVACQSLLSFVFSEKPCSPCLRYALLTVVVTTCKCRKATLSHVANVAWSFILWVCWKNAECSHISYWNIKVFLHNWKICHYWHAVLICLRNNSVNPASIASFCFDVAMATCQMSQSDTEPGRWCRIVVA